MQFESSTQLGELIGQASEAHHVYEQGLGHPDPNWAEWYAGWIFANALVVVNRTVLARQGLYYSDGPCA